MGPRAKLRQDLVERLVVLELRRRAVELERRNLIRVAAADAGMDAIEVALELEKRRDLIVAVPQHRLLEDSKLRGMAAKIEVELRRAGKTSPAT